jgi:GT2 family glycosyltransferase
MRITALVCTRNRGPIVADAVGSILDNDHSDFEVIVIDQSTDDCSESALANLRGDPRLHYVRSATSGLSHARNAGMSHARSPIVAMTDDDCVVPPEWLSRMESAFDSGERVAMVLGNVVPGEHDRSKGFIVGYARPGAFVAKGVSDKHRVEGMGACMGMRTDAWAALSGFDEMLGAGSAFCSADDTDMVIRALLAGYQILETPEVEVIHHGFHSWSQADSLVHGYLFGIGATIAKHIKCGHWPIAHVISALARRWLFKQPVIEYGFRPARRVRLVGFLRGVRAGLLTPVDHRTSQFV